MSRQNRGRKLINPDIKKENFALGCGPGRITPKYIHFNFKVWHPRCVLIQKYKE